MTGPYESILGRKIERVTETTVTFRPTPFQVATEDVRISGTIFDVDPKSGKCSSVRRIMVNEDESVGLANLGSSDIVEAPSR
jgi:calcineurin-like phosphoesterase